MTTDRSTSKRREVLLYLHGHGSDAAEAAERVTRIDPKRRRIHAAIDAPIGLGDGEGRSWFETTSRGVDLAGLERAVGHVIAVLAAWRAEEPDVSVILGGFSQGAAIAAAVASADRRNIDALVLHCGFLPDEVQLSDLGDLPTLVCRALDDDTVPDFFTDALVDALQTAGAEVRDDGVPGGHRFSDEMARITAEFLDGVDAR